MSRKTKIKVMISETLNPWFNLATEDYIFRDMDPEIPILFLWRNQETVVIGRFQNPWKECNLQQMEKDQVLLARRQSGGGAVFHDLGNTNFTFLNGYNDYDKQVNNQIICKAIATFGIRAYASGRNDLCVDKTTGAPGPRKISGSAFKETKDRCFHHGTLLIKANLNKLQNYLAPSKKKLASKGITSVRSRVANLSDFCPEINHDNLCKAIIEEFQKHYGLQCPLEVLDQGRLRSISRLARYYDQIKDWQWRFGETPQFSHHFSEHFSWGAMDIHLDSHHGKINDIQIFSDSLNPEMVELWMAHLKGQDYNPKGIQMALHAVQSKWPQKNHHLQEFADWMIQEIS